MNQQATVVPIDSRKDRRVEDERLRRIEDKMDGMVESLKQLVAVQRDIHHIFDRIDRLEKRVDNEEDRTRAVVRDEASSSASGGLTKDIMLAAIAAGLGILATTVALQVSG